MSFNHCASYLPANLYHCKVWIIRFHPHHHSSSSCPYKGSIRSEKPPPPLPLIPKGIRGGGISLSTILRGTFLYCFPSGKEDDSELFALIRASVARGDGNEGATAVNHYKRWSLGRGDSIHRPLDPISTPLAVKKQEILRIARFALFLVRTQGVSAKTASGYISTVNAWHARSNCVGLAADAKLSLSHSVLLGWARQNPPPRGVFQRLGITPQHLAKGMDLVLGERGRCSPANQNIRACLSAGFAGLLRTCETCLQDNKPSAFQILPERRHVSTSAAGVKTILIREAKRNTLQGASLQLSSPIQFYPGGTLVAAAEELSALFIADPAGPSDPLFRNPATNKPLRVSFIRDMVKRVAAAAGLDPSFFGAHSLRFANPSSSRFSGSPTSPHPAPLP